MDREEVERIRADVERLDTLAGELRGCQARANAALRDMESGRKKNTSMLFAAVQLSRAIRACRGFSEYFEKRTGVSLSEEKGGQE